MEESYMIDRISNNTRLIEKSLDASWLRNEAISNNIANVNTPGYKKSYVKFEDALANSIGQATITGNLRRDSHIPIGKNAALSVNPEISTEEFTSVRRDGNNVDIDVEMAELAKNTIKYNSLIAQLTKEFRKMSLVINDGRK
jgi:flagellar basal-body rod protein FlgB